MSPATRWWAAGAATAGIAAAASLPAWLPRGVVALRERIFTLVNGDEGVEVPGRLAGTESFKQLYAHPAANGRSRGAALSDLFWYWLAPGPQVHQEHLEPGPRYDQAARSTRRILAGPRKDEWEVLVARAAARALDPLAAPGSWSGPGTGRAPRSVPGRRPAGRARRTGRRVHLRDLMMPVWAEVYFEAVFGEPCPAEARDLITANADDVVSALKCTRLRHMRRRERLTGYLLDRIQRGAVPEGLPEDFSELEKAWYLQGSFFNTAVVQMSEAMAHLLLVIATHPGVQDRLHADPDDAAYLDRVIDETLRVYPLFGIAHRITSAEIEVDDATTLPAGSVLLFNYAAYQHAVPGDGAEFDPDRWEHPDAAACLHHIPFGVTANRPCPARGIAPLTMRVAAREVLRRFTLASSAGHSRSLPNRGPCLLLAAPTRSADSAQSNPAQSNPTLTNPASTNPALTNPAPTDRALTARLAAMRARDRWEDVTRSLAQLVLGSYMVWDARRQGLCRRYFAAEPPAPGRPSAQHGPGQGPRRTAPTRPTPTHTAPKPGLTPAEGTAP